MDNQEIGYARFMLKNSRWVPRMDPLMESHMELDNSNGVQQPNDCIGNFISFFKENVDLAESKNVLPTSLEMEEIQFTLSEREEQAISVLHTVQRMTPMSDFDSNGEYVQLLPAQEEICFSTFGVEDPYQALPLTPLMMKCCCDSPYPGSKNCVVSLIHEKEIPLSHLFLSSILVPPVVVKVEGSFMLFQMHIRNHLENGGTITTDKRTSSWMTLMDASYHLEISKGLLTDTLRTLKSKEAWYRYWPRTGSLQLTYFPHIGGVRWQLEEMAEMLYGAALLEYTNILLGQIPQ